MKAGQNTRHESPYFQTGIGGKVSLKSLIWSLNQNQHLKCKSLKRKKKNRK